MSPVEVSVLGNGSCQTEFEFVQMLPWAGYCQGNGVFGGVTVSVLYLIIIQRVKGELGMRK